MEDAADNLTAEELSATRAIQVEELRERFLYILEVWAPDKHRYQWLEQRTGIAAARWQNVTLGKQFPTLEMLIAVSNYMPNYSFWLMLGRDPLPLIGSTCPTASEWETYQSHRAWLKQRKKR